MKTQIFIKLLVAAAIMAFLGCETFLDEKADKKLVVPADLGSLQALLDIYTTVSHADAGEGEVASDDYYLTDEVWSALPNELDRRAYLWEPDFATSHTGGWSRVYRYVYYANVVLKGLDDVHRNQSNQEQWDDIKGQAHFLRARSFLSLVSIWAVAYDPASASVDLGIPLRLDPDFNASSKRATVDDTYKQVIGDLEIAVELLPITAEHELRASKPAALALLARTYLFMRDYGRCLDAVSESLRFRNDLMDFNEIDSGPNYPISVFNPEVIHHSLIPPITNPVLSVSRALVDTSLYDSYAENDLRKSLFFRSNLNGTHSIRGNYTGSSSPFTGVSTNELYLMRAECLVREGNIRDGMADLNHLLRHRYRNDIPYIDLLAESSEEALILILQERRKELVFRGLRFPDVKRLNKEGANIGFKRVLNGVEYTLPPNDLKFALPIPETVIERAPDIEQNPR